MIQEKGICAKAAKKMTLLTNQNQEWKVGVLGCKEKTCWGKEKLAGSLDPGMMSTGKPAASWQTG